MAASSNRRPRRPYSCTAFIEYVPGAKQYAFPYSYRPEAGLVDLTKTAPSILVCEGEFHPLVRGYGITLNPKKYQLLKNISRYLE